MELKLIHLAPLLPFKAKLWRAKYKGTGILDISLEESFNCEMSVISMMATVRHPEKYKVILHPLEDLRKSDHDMELAEIIGLQNAGHLIESLITDGIYSMDITTWGQVAEYLDRNHFDWRYELIGNGLAIDINTIKVES